MNSYVVTYYYGQQVHRAYAGSMDEARAYAAELIQHNQILPDDAMSIVRVADGRVMYHRPAHITLHSLYAQTSAVNRFVGRARSLIRRVRSGDKLQQPQASL